MGEKSDEIEIQRITLESVAIISKSLAFCAQALGEIKEKSHTMEMSISEAENLNRLLFINNVKLAKIFEQLDRDKYK